MLLLIAGAGKGKDAAKAPDRKPAVRGGARRGIPRPHPWVARQVERQHNLAAIRMPDTRREGHLTEDEQKLMEV